MRINYRYVLISLCIFFGFLYFSSFLHVFILTEIKDLSANIFTALITVLVIDWIVIRSKLQKTMRSVYYVKNKIFSIYTNLIWRMSPPKNWQKRIKENLDWEDFYRKIWSIIDESINAIEKIIDRYYYLIDEELTNDIIEMASLLNSLKDILLIESETSGDIYTLYQIVGYMTGIINHSIESIKHHNLIEYSLGRSMSWKTGEIPKITIVRPNKINIINVSKYQYSNYKMTLDELIKLRDECHKIKFSTPNEHRSFINQQF